MLQKEGQEVSSSTLPKSTAKNVKLAGTRHPLAGIVFNERGFPIFDDVAKVDLKIEMKIAMIQDRRLHFKEATKKLSSLIDEGFVDVNVFSKEQLQAIKNFNSEIPGLTWHHHEDLGRMQLVPRKIHRQVGHIGGFNLWFK